MIDLHRTAEAVDRDLGDCWHQALSLDGIAKALHAMQRFPEARTQWELALADFDDPRR
ncbi:hypothetical protein [Acrocarpospora macrocephala]|uniref:hypothetical protein n=1 Tax=Acrocarpospora macrocephala TaxID=150177 RepID=UPI0012D2C179|nr:hypothetical protein [Acrocarpospora macrocephala]